MAEHGKGDVIFIMDSSSWLAIEGHSDQNRILSAMVPLVEGGRIQFPPEVWTEIKDCSEISSWLLPYKKSIIQSFRSEADYHVLAGRIAGRFPGMAGIRGKKNKADPWVVATAVYGNGNSHIRAVVCDETVRKRPNRKIPTACEVFGVKCYTLLEMLHREYPEDGWTP